MRPVGESEFWRSVATAGPGDCWPWTRSLRDGRYGSFTSGGVRDRSHRWAWRYTHGAIPDGAKVLHSCDNPPCCNPAHLHLGTHADNMRERQERGRNRPRTRAGGHTKLTVAQVQEIKERWATRTSTADLAAEYGVSGQMVWRLGTGRSS